MQRFSTAKSAKNAKKSHQESQRWPGTQHYDSAPMILPLGLMPARPNSGRIMAAESWDKVLAPVAFSAFLCVLRALCVKPFWSPLPVSVRRAATAATSMVNLFSAFLCVLRALCVKPFLSRPCSFPCVRPLLWLLPWSTSSLCPSALSVPSVLSCPRCPARLPSQKAKKAPKKRLTANRRPLISKNHRVRHPDAQAPTPQPAANSASSPERLNGPEEGPRGSSAEAHRSALCERSFSSFSPLESLQRSYG